MRWIERRESGSNVVSEEDALARLQGNKECLELQVRHFLTLLALTWEDPCSLHDLLLTADERFTGWVGSRTDDLHDLLTQVHHLRQLLAALERSQYAR